MKSLRIILVYVLALFSGRLMGQKNESSMKSYFMTDLSYVSDAIFAGRKDSVPAPYILPSIGYYHTSGLFADASLSYLTQSGEGRIDLFLFSAGYRFEKKNLSGYLSSTKYFYNDISYNVQSSVTADITTFLALETPIVTPGFSAILFFTEESETDLILSPFVKKEIKLAHDNLIIAPSLSAQWGSQNFYNEYYQENRVGSRKGKGTNAPDNTETLSTTILEEATEFNLLNWELGLTVDLYEGHFIFSLNSYLAFPQSPATITTPEAVYTEELEPLFYGTIGLSYWFYSDKKSHK